MRLIPGGGPGPDEPDDGWVSGPALHDTRNITVTLCQFTGEQPVEGVCVSRVKHLHLDVDCLGVYVLASRVLDMGVQDLATLLSDPPANLTRPAIWTEHT